MYFIYYIPGGSTPPAEIVKYNWFNQSLINVKVLAKDTWNSLFNTGNGGPLQSPVIKGKDIELNNLSGQSSPVSSPSTPTAGPSNISPYTFGRRIRSIRPIKVDKSIQTELTALRLSEMCDFIINTTITKVTDNIDTDSNLLNSTQLLDNEFNNDN